MLIIIFYFSEGVVKIIPCENSRTFVNGRLVTEPTVLRSGKCRKYCFQATGVHRYALEDD